MTRINKPILISLITLCFAGILTSLWLYLVFNDKVLKLSSEKDILVTELTVATEELHNLKVQNTKITETLNKLSKNFESVAQKNSILSEKTAALKDKVSTLTSNFNQSLKEKHELAISIDTIKNEKTALIQQIKTLESESFITDTLKKKTFLEIEVNKLKQKLKEQKIENAKLLTNSQMESADKSSKITKEINRLKQELKQKDDSSKHVEILKKELILQKQEQEKLKSLILDLNKEKELIIDTYAKEFASEKALTKEESNKYNEAIIKYNQLMKKYNNLRADVSFLETESQNMKSDLKGKEATISDFKTQLNKSNESLQSRMQELARTKAAIENIITKTRSSVLEFESTSSEPISLDKIVVTPENKSIQKQADHTHYLAQRSQIKKSIRNKIEAKIIEVDYKYSFIVIDAGTNQGVKKDMKFDIVSKSNHKTPTSKILEIRNDITAVGLEALNNHQIKIGDPVILYH